MRNHILVSIQLANYSHGECRWEAKSNIIGNGKRLSMLARKEIGTKKKKP